MTQEELQRLLEKETGKVQPPGFTITHLSCVCSTHAGPPDRIEFVFSNRTEILAWVERHKNCEPPWKSQPLRFTYVY